MTNIEAQNTLASGRKAAMPNNSVCKMSDADYFAHPALSQSKLKRFLESPFKAMTASDDISLEAKTFGNALEVALFEGAEAINNKYAISKYKTYCDSMANEAVAHGKIMLTEAHHNILLQAIKNVDKCLNAKSLLTAPGDEQLVLFWERDGIQCKAKLDKLIKAKDKIIILDLKSFAPKSKISESSLAYHCKDYGYDIQARWYMDGVMATMGAKEDDIIFVNLFVEKAESPEIITAVIDESNLEAAASKIQLGLEVYKECLDNGIALTAEGMMLRRQNLNTENKSTFVTLNWYENTVGLMI